MKIGFDAKRAFLNKSGLGNYSRFIIQSLLNFYGENEYYLYTPKSATGYFSEDFLNNLNVTVPQKPFDKLFNAYWRSFSSQKDLKVQHLDIYHGLSGEIIHNIDKTNTKSVVTIHDLIFLRYPHLYKYVDRKIYTAKFKYACNKADKIVAISKQTKDDIIRYFNVPREKIEVIYQSCNAIFKTVLEIAELKKTATKYMLPENYMLFVGTIEKRKNLLTILKAIDTGKISLPLVVVGKPTTYLDEIRKYIKEKDLKNIVFLHNVPTADLPAIYQNAILFVYPSVFEGFGIPILEALYSKTPVITSKGSCFSEAGGPGSCYIDPENYKELAEKIVHLSANPEVRNKMIDEGIRHTANFDDKLLTDKLFNLYKSIL